MEKTINLNFKISSALKNIIGKELINNRFIAVFELVKNSYDAGAKNVTLKFQDLNTDKASISIIDDGCGMNLEDIKNKWLFVAYSEKNEKNVKRESYRDNINKRIYAGAKGVGRFSCDRLGAELNIITKKYNDNKINSININWDNFEMDHTQEFQNIPVTHKYIEKMPEGLNRGTILTIRALREKWTREDLLELKKSLKKLSNPNIENDDFKIFLSVPEELEEDARRANDNNKVNGKIYNDVFERLGLKTTYLHVEISNDGKTINTSLEDRGVFMFQYSQMNKYTNLKNIKVYMYYLNRAAKLNFTRLMGMEVVNYGSIFVYKNGFRILPYGEPGTDVFNIDRRKAQGYNRYLGTRELIGRIEIIGENEKLSETSSRDGGLIRNDAFEELELFFAENVIKVLEKYVVDIIKWGEPYKLNKDDIEKQEALNPQDVTVSVIGQIANIAGKDDLLDIKYNPQIIQEMDKKQEENLENSLKKLEKIAYKKEDENLIQLSKALKKNVISIDKARTEAQKEAEKFKEDNRIKVKQIEVTKKQNYLLSKNISKDVENLQGASHTSKLYSNIISGYLKDAIACLKEPKVNIKKIKEYLIKIDRVNQKALVLSEYMLKAGFSIETDSLHENIVDFIKEYVDEIYNSSVDKKLKINVTAENENIKMRFKPMSMGVIISNIISNAEKAKASKINITIKSEAGFAIVSFQDDGEGIDNSVEDIEELFEIGYTTTGGSGIGLYNIRQMMKEMKGNAIIEKVQKGFKITLRWPM